MVPRLFSRGKLLHVSRHMGGQPASMVPRLFSRGKSNMSRLWSARPPASMVPRLFSRGKRLPLRHATGGCGSFNGAAAFQPRKGAWCLKCVKKHIASMVPRLFSRGKPIPHPSMLHPGRLQWCRGFSAAERYPWRFLQGYMRGLQWCRGFSAAESHIHPIALPGFRSFNGAAAFQPRKGERTIP